MVIPTFLYIYAHLRSDSQVNIVKIETAAIKFGMFAPLNIRLGS